MPFDVQELYSFAEKCENAGAQLKPYMSDALEDAGEKFLDLVKSNIEAAGNVDTGKLLASFSKGSNGNIFKLDSGALSLTIGTIINYAKYVNAGHKQQPGRFIPGVWNGSHFQYQPGAKTGMVLKASYVKGSKFFDNAEKGAQELLDSSVQKAFQEFWSSYFG